MSGQVGDTRRHSRLSTVTVSGLIGLGVASAVALIVSRVIEFQVLGPWGVLYGTLAFIASFGIAMAVSGRRRLGWGAVAIAAGALAAGAWWWVVAWDIAPFTLEGAWLWPLAMVSTFAAMAALRQVLRRRR